MAVQCCPTCGRAIPKPRAVQVQPVDLAQLTTAELFAYHKRQAPMMDLAFLQRFERLMSPELWDRMEACRNPTAKDLAVFRTAYRIERSRAERLACIPAIGTSEWSEAMTVSAALAIQ